MNKRIQELAKQARKALATDAMSGGKFDMQAYEEKFAELIVAECCQQINSQCFPSHSREWCEKGAWNGYLIAQIRENFGVAE